MNYNSIGQHSYQSGSDISFTSNDNTCSQSMEGYDYEFVPPVEQRYECPICLLILREPRQTKCGHRFCRDCIIRWLRAPCTRCPVDNEQLVENDVFPDNFAKREILNFNIKCPNKKDGCDEIVTLGKLQNHLDICQHSLVPCPNRCASILHRCDLQEHMTQHCEFRIIFCEKCSDSIKANAVESHRLVCPNVLQTCTYCGQSKPRAQMKSHVEIDCQHVQIRCMFNSLGCRDQMLRSLEDKHLKSHSIEHLNLLCHAVNKLVNHFENIINKPSNGEVELSSRLLRSTSTSSNTVSFKTSSMSPLEGPLLNNNPFTDLYLTDTKIEHPMTHEESFLSGASNSPSTGPSSHSTFPNRNPLLLQRANANSDIFPYDNSAIKQVVQSSSSVRLVQELKSSFEEQMSVQKQKIEELTHKLASMEQLNADLALKVGKLKGELEESEGRFCNGDFYWRIPEFSQYQMKAISGEPSMLHSPPFYTSTWGYKMCIRANLASNLNENAGHFLSLFIHFMQGHNDHFITWPFSGKIILSIIDQNPDRNSQVNISETLIAKPNLIAFQKPTSFRNHKGFGYIEFISLMTLKTKNYLKDDSLIIRAQVFPENN
ncbi:TNF receptor-associated factor 6 [Biomphalaria glabrata]|nr:TNF receptor-associated factor 6-like [Biomphalaria glabrata]